MGILINWIVSTLVIFAGAYLLPGVHVESFLAAFVAALTIGVINAILKPILLLLTLPINILTLGLFTLVINASLIMLAAYLVPGFAVASFLWALLFGLILSIVSTLIPD